MRSIRLSLVVYFLALLCAALGVASLLVYRSAQRTLRDKEEAQRKLIQAQYEKRVQDERNRLDEQLLTQAQSLARRVRIVNNQEKFRARATHVLGLATTMAGPSPWFAGMLWIAQ